MIQFGKIFKQAFQILKAHKFLWVLGLFLVWGEIFNLFSYSTNNPNQEVNQLNQATQVHAGGVVTALALVFVLIVVMMWFYFRARTAVIIGTKAVLDKKDTGFKKSFRAGKHFYVRIFGIWFVTVFLTVLALVILASPVVYLSTQGLGGRAALLGIIAVLIFVPLAFLAGFINNLAPMFVVQHDLQIGKAVNASFDMVKKYWAGLLSFSILLGLLNGIILGFLSFCFVLGFEFFTHLFYNTGGFQITISSILFAFACLIALLFFGSGVASYQQISWVLLFNDLVKPQKLEEEEIVPVPEVV